MGSNAERITENIFNPCQMIFDGGFLCNMGQVS